MVNEIQVQLGYGCIQFGLTVEIQAYCGVAFAQFVLCIHFIFASILNCYI